MIVIDATVAVKLITREPGADAALARISKETDRLAPDWVRLEVASALSKKVRTDGLPAQVATMALAAVDSYLTETAASLDLIDEAFALSLQLQHAVYDCLYLALAIRHDALVVTHDEKFVRRAIAAGYATQVELLK
ncbi:type II toxin-antitoxin system VapC family toxin [Sphingomonas sp. SUN019]|uniref:type II toxin-antitoxin system VapC family toxin n=1 Tax=Sphingomonas sp. SUN019 TaxID=2937788 RepID=UPI00216485F9|nr:type II toxin-antitoxin system VapC family toxin [Sphingomonas sp. SUN019]UVO52251.1 type II toxin-antitoxin system VapC family toxin [Sphingomonas sp. SUN019]